MAGEGKLIESPSSATEPDMTFEQLDAFKQELLADAYSDDLKQRLRLVAAVPISAAVTGIVWWIFARGDSTGFGVGIFWIVGCLLGLLVTWMSYETLINQRVKRTVQSFNLELDAQRELVASLRATARLEARRSQALMTIFDEMGEGLRRGKRMGRKLDSGD